MKKYRKEIIIMKRTGSLLAVVLSLMLVFSSFSVVFAGGGNSNLDSWLNTQVTGLKDGNAVRGSTIDIKSYSALKERFPTATFQWDTWKSGGMATKKTITSSDTSFTIPNDSSITSVFLRAIKENEDESFSESISIVDASAPSATIVTEPKLDVYPAVKMLKVDIDTYIIGNVEYYTSSPSDVATVSVKTLRLIRNGKKYKDVTSFTDVSGKKYAGINSVPLSYGAKDTFKLQAIAKVAGVDTVVAEKTFTATSKKMPTNKVYAIKLSANKVLLRWTKISYATGYKIYMGKKKIKTVKKGTTYKAVVSKKKIGKAKLRVIPYIVSGGKTYNGKSTTAKPKANVRNFKKNSLNPKDYEYMTARFIVRKVSLKGKTYTVTGYAVNTRIFALKKFKKLNIKIKSHGKVVANKTFKNYKVKVSPMGKKKIVLKIKGKANQDIVYGGGWQSNTDDKWVVD